MHVCNSKTMERITFWDVILNKRNANWNAEIKAGIAGKKRQLVKRCIILKALILCSLSCHVSNCFLQQNIRSYQFKLSTQSKQSK